MIDVGLTLVLLWLIHGSGLADMWLRCGCNENHASFQRDSGCFCGMFFSPGSHVTQARLTSGSGVAET